MKSLLEQKKDSSSTTPVAKSETQVKENNNLFNRVDKLSADRDVRISNTMIKITYKKALKDQNLSDSAVDPLPEPVFLKTVNESDSSRNDDIDISIMATCPSATAEGPSYHSTPKTDAFNNEQKRKYLNGLNLSPKVIPDEKPFVAKVQNAFGAQENDSSTANESNKQLAKPELGKRFLKNKTSIIKRDDAECKKLKLNKFVEKKDRKLENGMKKNARVVKRARKVEGLKRKASSSELNVLGKYKKLKLSEEKIEKAEGKERSEESLHRIGRKPIMLVDPDLPTGWTRYIRTKNKGSANEQYVVYVVNPQGKKFRFKWKLRKYLERTNSPLDVDQFFFGLYQRPKTSNSSGIYKGRRSYKGNLDFLPTPDDQSEDSEGYDDEESDDASNKSSEGKELLLYDPDLPYGWKRVIHSNSENGRKQVHIISPDGKIFRRRYRLLEYLTKHQFSHSLDRFYFGLYPKKEGNEREPETEVAFSVAHKSDADATMKSELESDSSDYKDSSKEILSSPMYDDPKLPEGWKRFIKIRNCGESAGRMEVVIVSPDGRRHRSRKHLEHYLAQKKLQFKAQDFDFHVFGKSSLGKRSPQAEEAEPEPEPEPEPNELMFVGMKKKFTDKPVPELDIASLKEVKMSREGRMISSVNGLAMSCGLTSARNVRRPRLPMAEHEKQLRTHLSTEGETSFEGCEIPTFWIQRLVKCRGDFRTLEPDAAATVGEATKEFLKRLSFEALALSKEPERELRYEDVAEIVDRTESLSPLRTLIPKKVTYKEYLKLNRPKQFLSFI